MGETRVAASGRGIFFTISALYFTRIVGLSVIEVGTGRERPSRRAGRAPGPPHHVRIATRWASRYLEAAR